MMLCACGLGRAARVPARLSHPPPHFEAITVLRPVRRVYKREGGLWVVGELRVTAEIPSHLRLE
jgi:hypothetical protein